MESSAQHFYIFTSLFVFLLFSAMLIYYFRHFIDTMASERDVVLDMSKYIDQRMRVTFQGGREGLFLILIFYLVLYYYMFTNFFLFLVDGLLKGYDKLDNLVLDDCFEYLRGIMSFCLHLFLCS